jgi:Spy/CpxP family protein refolding chaperone
MEERGGFVKSKVFQNLDLTEAQKEQVNTLQRDFRAKMQALNQKENITVKEQRDARFSLAKEHRAKMTGLLTAEQQYKLKEQRANQQNKMQEVKSRRFEDMTEKLSLNETQKAALQKERDEQRMKMQSIRQNDAIERSEMQASIQEMRAKHEATMKSVLTKEQYKQWEEMKKQIPQRGGHGRGHMHGHGASA